MKLFTRDPDMKDYKPSWPVTWATAIGIAAITAFMVLAVLAKKHSTEESSYLTSAMLFTALLFVVNELDTRERKAHKRFKNPEVVFGNGSLIDAIFNFVIWLCLLYVSIDIFKQGHLFPNIMASFDLIVMAVPVMLAAEDARDDSIDRKFFAKVIEDRAAQKAADEPLD